MTQTIVRPKPELLAPAGSLEVFETAVAAGADAVYLGAPFLNARRLARNFSLDEIAAMVDYGHRAGVRVYLALNSLLKEEEIPQAVEFLSVCEALAVDALIIQDLGIYYLAKKFFPNLRLHASTLLLAHNSLAVRQFELMGFKRIVLAREMPLEEIRAVRQHSEIDLEVFIHGALCFSYSGLCLFSSYLGGKSGLRGHCVQPCRRRYSLQGRTKKSLDGYFFSMNDLSGLDAVAELKKLGIASLKIEGRMRNSQYVGQVVKAYRLLLDAEVSTPEIREEAAELLNQAMGRSTCSGYFPTPKPLEAISPQRSGNIGMFLGRLENCRGKMASVFLKDRVQTGDRLRLHCEESGERESFTLKKLLLKKRPVSEAAKGEQVMLELPVNVSPGDSLYKVDLKEQRLGDGQSRKIKIDRSSAVNIRHNKARQLEILKKIDFSAPPVAKSPDHGRRLSARHGRPPEKVRSTAVSPPCWLKIDDLRILKNIPDRFVERIVVTMDRQTLAWCEKNRKIIGRFRNRLIWGLPPVIAESAVEFYRNGIRFLADSGFKRWFLGHIGQVLLFHDPALPGSGSKQFELYADYTINILNSLSLLTLREYNFSRGVVSIETDRDNLKRICSRKTEPLLGALAYGKPPLFISRLDSRHFEYDRFLVSPKGEKIALRRQWDLTLALAEKPFSWLPWLSELAGMGLGFILIDLSHFKLKPGDFQILWRRITGKEDRERLSSFNYNGKLQ